MIRIKELISTMADKKLHSVTIIEYGKGNRYNTKTMSEMFEDYGNRGVKSWITDKYINDQGKIRLSLYIEVKENKK